MEILSKADELIDISLFEQSKINNDNRDSVEMPMSTILSEKLVATEPLANSAGIFKDDPFWEDMMAAIIDQRTELDSE